MTGMDKTTGKHLDGMEHLLQSIDDILSTRVETLPLLREYGGGLADLVDAPINPQTLLDFYVATVEALARWEPRITILRVWSEPGQSAELSLSMEAYYRHNGERIVLEGIKLS